MNKRALPRFSLPLAAAAGLAVACGPRAEPEAPESDDEGPPAAAEAEVARVNLSEVGLDADDLNPAADPCEDFYDYACGGWLEDNEIPDDRGRHGRFFEVRDRTLEILRAILEDAAAGAGDGEDPALAAIGDYYGACMDEEGAEERGIDALEGLLEAIEGATDPEGISAAVTALHRHRIWAPFAIGSTPDYKDSESMIASMRQAGLGLPDRGNYLDEGEREEELRATYRGHVASMFELLGEGEAAAARASERVLELERELAEASKTREELRDRHEIYNKVDREGVTELAPDFDWEAYFSGLGHPDIEDITVGSPDFLERVGELLTEVEAEVWQDYLTWHVVHATAHALPDDFVEQNFVLTRALTGQPELEPRWRRCVDAVDDAMGEYLAQPFIDEAFSSAASAEADRMVAAISEAFAERVEDLGWMGEGTRERALDKLEAMEHLIGHPEEWEEYDFPVRERDYAGNELAARAFELQRDLDRIDEPVDRSRWYMTPQTVNAYYAPTFNQMVFPAGILQPPFFSEHYHTPVNLGAIGMVIGHELTHGFDDSGARFDERGNLENWWEEDDEEQFEARGQCVVDQYSEYEVLPGVHLSGELALGENIADIGGARLAFQAYRSLREGADEVYVADGYDEDQQFFLALGRAWCADAREEELRQRVRVGPHSPERYRVNGSLANVPEFADAFACEEGTAMNPKEMCEVW